MDQDGDTEQDEEEILECTEMEVADVIESAVAHNSIKPSADAEPCLTDADAAIVEKSAETMKALTDAKAQLMAYGLVGAAATIEKYIRKEKRRIREISREDPDVLVAVARVKDRDRAAENRERILTQEANEKMMTKRKLMREIKDADAILKKKKQQIADEEHIADARQTVKSVRLSFLGDQIKNCGGVVCRKRRDEVLDRISKMGTGLSPSQKNEWAWFKEAWQGKMLDEHGEQWVRIFAGWMQEVMDSLERGQANAFSVFVHRETRRCFNSDVALELPGFH